MDQIQITPELAIIGIGASFFVEFLRALLLKIEDYPRLAAIWKYLPPMVGAILILIFPSAIKDTTLLLLLAHGAASPAVGYAVYPILKKAFVEKSAKIFDPLPAAKEPAPAQLPEKE